LDYATTGLLLIGKTAQSIIALNRLFRDKAIQKKYYAISIGEMKNNNGSVNTPIDKKASLSHYKVLSCVKSSRFKQLNLVDLSPKTGRRHQLRKHLAGLGHPILGDKDYSSKNLILYGKGMYLHAYSLSFRHPFTDTCIDVKDELPLRFKKIFKVDL
jgi:23S rRNA pseudouridine1911/1915/1917 synthase